MSFSVYNISVKRILAFLVFLFHASQAFAGGPLLVDVLRHTGQPATWKNHKLVWYAESGDLSSSVNNEEAIEWIDEAFSAWASAGLQNEERNFVQVVNLDIEFGGIINQDITLENVSDYVNDDQENMIVVFDRDGSITEAMFPTPDGALKQNKDVIVGFAAPSSPDSSMNIFSGVAVFNGRMLEANRLGANSEQAQLRFRGTIFHELGHSLNLDHAQTNLDLALPCTLGGVCEGSQNIPTMFPELKTRTQTILSWDDKIALALLYPTREFSRSFCTAYGRIEDGNGRPLRGVNVLASRILDGENTARVDTRSFVSGAFYGDDENQCMDNSQYVLAGLVPGKTYQVTYEALTDKYTDYSGFRPLHNPPRGFASGTIPSKDDSTTISCERGGEVIEMKTVQIETANPCENFTPIAEAITIVPTISDSDKSNRDSNDNEPSSGSSGGCSLIIPK